MEEVKEKVSLGYIQSLYDADIAIILSYSQDQRSNQTGPGALLDLSMVSNFIAPSVKTETIAYVKDMVVHMPSNALIFRSTGSDFNDKNSTPYGQRSVLETESVSGIISTTDEFSVALNNKLSKFDKFDFNNAVSLELTQIGTSQDNRNANWKKVDAFKFLAEVGQQTY